MEYFFQTYFELFMLINMTWIFLYFILYLGSMPSPSVNVGHWLVIAILSKTEFLSNQYQSLWFSY